MVKLLIIADDFTGALDTGVQFAAGGAETRVVTNVEYDFESAEEEVLVLDAETRHLKKEEAYEVVFRISRRAFESGVPYLYKKTDSALRGNVGAELRAVLDATGRPSIHFLPAFPRMNRITRNGIHYIDGVPVHESVFGQDPFEPVTCSSIRQMIESDIPVTVVSEMGGWRPNPGIMVYDASSDRELKEAGRFLMEADELHLMAGCAGFAGVLPELLHLNRRADREITLTEPFFVACGSVNPITKSQLDFAQKNGCERIRLTPPQKLEQDYYETAEGRHFLEEWAGLAAEQKVCILDTNDPPGSGETLDYAREHGITLEDLRVRISSTLGYILKGLLELGLGGTLLITGGDCLIGFMKHIGCEAIAPVCEMAPGTVLSEIEVKGRRLGVISKSGGFGAETLLVDLARRIKGKEEEKKVCLQAII
ncbi:four-carbon acid sugar kinase family protein [Clostridiaceae bacterium]|nr:four-carbon acid sugar kinase family protein [Clostridium sp.]NBI69783.1 four-carbon acid sugar kinase family protein [Clostridiaceae bacterium]